jgi:hypothetical protein
MWRIAWRLSKGYRLRPWSSPYLRWRMETYLGVHADHITPRAFLRIVWQERQPFLRYLLWADRMDRR